MEHSKAAEVVEYLLKSIVTKLRRYSWTPVDTFTPRHKKFQSAKLRKAAWFRYRDR